MPVRLNSSGGGSVTLDVPAVGTTTTLNLPAVNGTVVAADNSGNVTYSGATTFSGNATFNAGLIPSSSFLRNRIINGDMRIDQRNAGASVTPGAATYTLDRWLVGEDTAGSLSVQQSSVVPSGQGFSNSLLVTVTSPSGALGATQYVVASQRVEGFNVSDFELGSATAKTFTLSFWVRSSVTGTYSVSLRNSADTRSYIATYSVNAANTWEYKTLTITGDTTGTWLATNGTGLSVNWTLGVGSTYQGTAGSWQDNLLAATSGSVNLAATNGATFFLTGVQLEVGSVATPFERRQFGQELALCQRYYQTGSVWACYTLMFGQTVGNNFGLRAVAFPVTMRTTPTVTTFSEAGTAGRFSINRGGNFVAGTIIDGGGFTMTNATGGNITPIEVTFSYTASAEL